MSQTIKQDWIERFKTSVFRFVISYLNGDYLRKYAFDFSLQIIILFSKKRKCRSLLRLLFTQTLLSYSSKKAECCDYCNVFVLCLKQCSSTGVPQDILWGFQLGLQRIKQRVVWNYSLLSIFWKIRNNCVSHLNICIVSY